MSVHTHHVSVSRSIFGIFAGCAAAAQQRCRGSPFTLWSQWMKMDENGSCIDEIQLMWYDVAIVMVIFGDFLWLCLIIQRVTSNSLILKSLPIFSGNESSNLRLMAGSILIYMQRVSYVYRYICVCVCHLPSWCCCCSGFILNFPRELLEMTTDSRDLISKYWEIPDVTTNHTKNREVCPKEGNSIGHFWVKFGCCNYPKPLEVT